MERRSVLNLAGGSMLAAGVAPLLRARAETAGGGAGTAQGPADHTLRTGTGLVEVAPNRLLSTTTYNGQFPGPLLRFQEGRRVVVDIHNDTDTPEQLHWHGQIIPVDADGAAGEGTPYIPAHGMRRISFVPGPAGFRFYHTHVVAGADLTAGQYSGQVGPVYIFKVIALDGNPVPAPAEVPVLWIGTAERISAIVEMNHPGVWIMGDLADDDRSHGMGIMVEYAGRGGKPQWVKPPPFRWDYRRFGKRAAPVPQPDEIIETTFAKQRAADHGFNRWTINGVAFSMENMEPMFHLRRGSRYRLRMRNASDDLHPMHLHRHTFELTRIAGQPTAGVRKDVAMLGGFQEMEVDFTANQPGLSLYHCHMQLHMDFGFMALFDCAVAPH